ncbi:MAG: hypothetical protein NC200_01525 [Candidatus Gastranaerophilales bacterium]|nr:hypothetical protein [Candidatus Gastranaerophilales bacterium]MCM1338185.1 hypothetical protein [Muribaculaceae bacterium]
MQRQSLTLVEPQQQEQTDLMSIKELCLKHGYDYNYLYKWSIIKGAIPVYYRGIWKLSENEVQEFSRIQQEQKLAKIRKSVGDK